MQQNENIASTFEEWSEHLGVSENKEESFAWVYNQYFPVTAYANRPVVKLNGVIYEVKSFMVEDLEEWKRHSQAEIEKGNGFCLYLAVFRPSKLWLCEYSDKNDCFKRVPIFPKVQPHSFLIRGFFYPLDNQSKQG